MLNPIMSDPRVSQTSLKSGPPESRNFGFRVGTQVVIDEETEILQKMQLNNAKKISFFTRKGSMCRGTKNGAVKIMRSPRGGFMASPKDNPAL